MRVFLLAFVGGFDGALVFADVARGTTGWHNVFGFVGFLCCTLLACLAGYFKDREVEDLKIWHDIWKFRAEYGQEKLDRYGL